jgi:hypothetical protein
MWRGCQPDILMCMPELGDHHSTAESSPRVFSNLPHPCTPCFLFLLLLREGIELFLVMIARAAAPLPCFLARRLQGIFFRVTWSALSRQLTTSAHKRHVLSSHRGERRYIDVPSPPLLSYIQSSRGLIDVSALRAYRNRLSAVVEKNTPLPT